MPHRAVNEVLADMVESAAERDDSSRAALVSMVVKTEEYTQLSSAIVHPKPFPPRPIVTRPPR